MVVQTNLSQSLDISISYNGDRAMNTLKETTIQVDV